MFFYFLELKNFLSQFQQNRFLNFSEETTDSTTNDAQSLDNNPLCSKGCLFCTTPTTCGLCDQSTGWVLDSSTKQCTSLSQSTTNCKTKSITGICLQCEDGFYLNGEECNVLSEKNYISNCAWFDKNECRLCERNYFFNGETCQEAGEKLEGCEFYNFENNGQSCLLCSSGKVLSDGRCIEDVKNDENCAHFVDFECQECAHGFRIQPNMLLHTLFSGTTNPDFTIHDFFKSQEVPFYRPPALVCSQIEIPNCETFSLDGSCEKCEAGYSLVGEDCQIVSDSAVASCKTFRDLETCIQCDEDFYLDPSGNCLQINPQQFCLEYKETSTKSECLTCFNSFYLSQNLSCLRRIYSRNIPSCEILSSREDTCQSCQSGFFLSNDKLSCFQEIMNCKEYLPSTRESGGLSCRKCASGHHFDVEGNCVLGAVENCSEFKLYVNECEVCEQGHFLEKTTGTCVKHAAISACNGYDLFSRDKCQKHFADYRELVVLNKCVPVTIIDKCVKYSRENFLTFLDSYNKSVTTSIEFWKNAFSTKCDDCEAGYEPSSEKDSCVTLTSIQNCNKMSNSKCIECQADMVLNSDEICIEPWPFKTSFCSKQSETYASLGCLKCEDDSLHFPMQSSTICVNESNPILTQNVSNNCTLFQINADNSKKCVSCESGFSLNKDTSSCTNDDQCFAIIKNPLSNYSLIKNSENTYFNYTEKNLFSLTESLCLSEQDVSSLISQCHIYSHGQFGKLACVKCRANYLPIYDISNASDQAQKNHTKFDSSGTFISKVSTRQEITECISEASITQITNCEKYYRIGVSDFGCVSCAFGFIGKVSNSRREIVECVDAQQSQCDATKKFEGLGWESTSVKSLKFPLGRFHISS